uniref:Uncharacterized protein n=1 Tax=viral metagenome TaxID=1070528 RepID=A0A6M3LII3_9ZZZZ
MGNVVLTVEYMCIECFKLTKEEKSDIEFDLYGKSPRCFCGGEFVISKMCIDTVKIYDLMEGLSKRTEEKQQAFRMNNAVDNILNLH